MDDLSHSFSDVDARDVNVVEPHVQSTRSEKLAELAANSRYSAPSVSSFPLSGPIRVDQVSMISNL